MQSGNQIFDAMEAAGLSLWAPFPAPWGHMHVPLSPSELPDFLSDRMAWFTRRHGILQHEYEAWLATEGFARCGALTNGGVRCKRHVAGGGQLSLDDWLRQDGGLCPAHEKNKRGAWQPAPLSID